MKKIIIALLITTLLVIASGCESINRGIKNIDSELGGLNRTVEVYDQQGNLIRTYEGKLDVKVNDYGNKVLFDLDGKRVQLFNATVIVEEQ